MLKAASGDGRCLRENRCRKQNGDTGEKNPFHKTGLLRSYFEKWMLIGIAIRATPAKKVTQRRVVSALNIHTISYIRGKRAAVSRFDPMRPQDISIADYSYVLPGESIAFYPLAEVRSVKRTIVILPMNCRRSLCWYSTIPG
jgi:hypothetical protein